MGLRSSDKVEGKRCVCVYMLVIQSCLTLCNPIDCSLPGSSVHEILQARILEWVAIPFPGDLPDPRIEARSALQADSLLSEPLEKPQRQKIGVLKTPNHLNSAIIKSSLLLILFGKE